MNFLLVDEFKPWNSILVSGCLHLFQTLSVILIKADNQLSGSLIRNIQLFRNLVKHSVSFHTETRHQ